jgi:tetratricopeptide (TPR) repeat protein
MSPNSFSRKVADQMLAAETEAQIAEQKAALAQNPEWAAGHYQLAQLYRVHGSRRDEAKRELLLALELEPSLADAHLALGELYIAEGDLTRAREHANYAAQFGNPRLSEQITRYDQSSLSPPAPDGTEAQ